jgi:hypothetical protein
VTTATTPAPRGAMFSTPRRRRLLAAAAVTLAAAALASCSPTTSTNPSGTQGITAPSVAPANLTTLDGRQVSVPGNTPTALFFFSVECGQCVGGGKSLAQAQAQAAAQKADGNAGFVLVDMDPKDSPEAIPGFLEQIGGQNLPTVIDHGAALTGRFQVAAVSTLIVIDPTGKVTYRATEPASDKILDALHEAGAQ